MQVWQPYFQKLNDKSKQEIVEKVLQIALEAIPEAEPALPYGVPGLKLGKKNLIAVAAHASHLGIYPFSPEVVATLEPKLPQAQSSKGTLKFDFDQLPSADQIKLIVTESQKRIV